MPDRRAPTATERSAALVRDAATQAVALALAGSESAQTKAIARALRDERVDRDLHDHELHLQAINGSQERMAKSLSDLHGGQIELVEASGRQAAVAEALASAAAEQAAKRFSKRQLIVAWVGGGGAWAAILAAVLATGH